MKFPQNPFSLFDFLGYLIPGMFFFYLIFFLSKGIFVVDTDIILQTLKDNNDRSYILPFVLVSYLLGHSISLVSSYTIEKYSHWKYGYPSQYVIGEKASEGYFTLTRNRKKKLNVGWRFFVGLAILPVTFFDNLLQWLFDFNYIESGKLTSLSIDIIKNNVRYAYSKISKGENEFEIDWQKDYFQLLYHYVLERTPNHSAKYQNYVALYGFVRTMALYFVILFWTTIIVIMSHKLWNISNLLLLILFGFCAYIFFVTYLKFYKRYSMEVLMALTSIASDVKKEAS